MPGGTFTPRRTDRYTANLEIGTIINRRDRLVGASPSGQGVQRTGHKAKALSAASRLESIQNGSGRSRPAMKRKRQLAPQPVPPVAPGGEWLVIGAQ